MLAAALAQAGNQGLTVRRSALAALPEILKTQCSKYIYYVKLPM